MDLTDPQQWHGYSYAGASPVTNSDADGLLKKEASDKTGGGGIDKTLENGTSIRYTPDGVYINGYFLPTNHPDPEALAKDVDDTIGTREYDNELDQLIDTIWAMQGACSRVPSLTCLDNGIVGHSGPSFYTTLNRDLHALKVAKGLSLEGVPLDLALTAGVVAAGAMRSGGSFGGGPNAESLSFKNGSLFQANYVTSNGTNVGVLAEIEVNGRQLHFRSLTVFADESTGRGGKHSVGAGDMLRIRGDLLARVAETGRFDEVRVSYHRTTPGPAKGLEITKVYPVPPNVPKAGRQ